MSSIPELPAPGSDVTVLITRVNLNPLCVLVEIWGSFSQKWKTDYECLAKDIQSSGKIFHESEGNPGDQCLVKVVDTWYRSRIVSKNGSNYSVFLIDKGLVHSVTTDMLAWGKKEHFHLPPEVEFCVLSNILPRAPENRWSPIAIEFLRSLSGKCVKACVQDVLVPHRAVVLDIPCISKQMYEMGFARKLSADRFKDFLLETLQSSSGAPMSPETPHSSDGAPMSLETWPNYKGSEPVGPRDHLHKQGLFMYPERLTGTVETVIITEVTNPQRVFCQLKVFSQELKKLTEQITQHYEGRLATCIVSPDMLGSPCAARGSDGRWYRSVLQQVLPTGKVVEVLNVDYGRKQFVQVENVRPLAAEFFRMPVGTYICALHGIIDRGVGWTATQIDNLKALLLYKTLIAKFEYQSISEGVHYVTLYGDENTNINNLFGSRERCLLECEKTLGDYAVHSTAHRYEQQVRKESLGSVSTSLQAVKGTDEKGIMEKLQVEDLPLNSSHVAVVQHVSSPSEFWIQTQKYADEMGKLMDSIYDLYKDSNSEKVRNPTVGLFCAAKANDGDFYRAVVSEVSETRVKVFFVDYGSTEEVDRSDIRAIPDKFKKLPQLVLKCKLADIKPKDKRWSHSATDFFIKAVTDKVLNVNVTAKYDGGYVVCMTDSAAHGERDISQLMCSSGFAEKDQAQKQPISRMTMQPTVIPAALGPGVTPLHREGRISLQHPNTVGPTSNERSATFKEHMFPIGSTLEVSVCYIESPNDFWCQLVQNAGHLKLLMQDMQTYYASSAYQPFLESACVARHPDNGMWYRALVIHKHVTPQVDVLLVDYGQMKTVTLYELRKICPEFLSLKGQAFRCSLYNLVDPTSTINDWSEEAVVQFQDFVDTAASNHVVLKCTIYAIMYSEQKVVYNIVDLETPFESVCTLMASVASSPPKKASRSPLRLDTYYYSTHNIKTGTEEMVTVTYVNSVNQFYCQLERNAHVMEDLVIKLNSLCHQLKTAKLPAVFGTVCFAKYTDGLWYRGQIKATQPSILVHFVDYGDTLEVDKSDLLPVPTEAGDIVSVPVQAIECGLSDIPASVSSEVNSWFENSVTEHTFRALVVAKEPGGKLLVELYSGKTQVNSKIKKKFQIKMHSEEQVVFHGKRALEVLTNDAKKNRNALPQQVTERQNDAQILKTNQRVSPKPVCQMEDDMKTTKGSLRSAPKPIRPVGENGHKAKAPTLKLYRPPQQRKLSGTMPTSTGNGSEPADANTKQSKQNIKHNIPTDPKQVIKSKLPDTESQKKSYVATDHEPESFPKLADLPSKSITSGMEADVFVSHCNSPLSFYVQFVEEEDNLFSIVGKLNDYQTAIKPTDVENVHPGDLVQAEFPDDSSWYRAVVREIHGNSMALVEFVDYGNTAVVSTSKICRIHKSLLQFPTYSTHCMLSDGVSLGKELALDPEVVSNFKKDIGDNGDKELKCRFIRQSESVWEVSLEDSGVNVMCKVPTTSPAAASDCFAEKLGQMEEKPVQSSVSGQMPTEKSSLQPCPLRYVERDFLEGQQLMAYVTTINDDQSFWCQSADSDELDKITVSVSQHKTVNTDSLSPGSPCIARYAEDEVWYRAEVISKEEDMRSVFFVDYGNKSQVSARDVLQMQPELCEIPPQAFLCELEGFEAYHGSWEDGAIDTLSELITDKELLLTVNRVTRGEQGKIKCFVQMECEGQVINETMRAQWRSFTNNNNPDAVDLSSSYKAPQLPFDSDTPKELVIPETDIAVSFSQSVGDQKEEEYTEELNTPCDAGDSSQLSCLMKSDGSVPSQSSADAQKEDVDEILSESSVTVQPCSVTEMEMIGEKVSKQVVKSLPATVMSEAEPNSDCLSYDVGKDQTMLPLLDKGEQDTVKFESGRDFEKKAASTIESLVGPEYTNFSPCSDDELKQAVAPYARQTQKVCNKMCFEAGPQSTQSAPTTTDTLVAQEEKCVDEEECQTVVAELECLPKEQDSHNAQDNADIVKDSEFGLLRPAESLPINSACVVWSPVKSWCKARILKKFKDSTLVLLVDYDSEMMVDPDSIFDTVLPESDQCDNDDSPDLDGALPHNESQAGATIEQEDETGEVAPQEEPPCTPTYGKNNLTEDDALAHQEDKHLALLVDTEPAVSEQHTDIVLSQKMDDVAGQGTSSIEEACQADVCIDLEHGAEAVGSEQLLHTTPTRDTDSEDDVIPEEMSNSSDSSLGVQLSTVTHLSLVIINSSDDTVVCLKETQSLQQQQH
ncbi:tudor domain-containing 6 [Myripristis murdjan]|uniref:Tudor domain containing 6 n=1 Tax=Myripristis murdjan TaxID=586833 RepID=A0A667Y057_9TELE|nr:tudor domain-containing protein 6 [Myripristis murdjan]